MKLIGDRWLVLTGCTNCRKYSSGINDLRMLTQEEYLNLNFERIWGKCQNMDQMQYDFEYSF